MWMQWRVVWMLCELYSKLEKREDWLKLAESGYNFLTKHGRDEQGRYYFSLARDGRPTMAPYSVFSECFAVMGCAAYYRATGDEAAKAEALRAFENYLQRESRPKGEWTKEMPGRDPMRKPWLLYDEGQPVCGPAGMPGRHFIRRGAYEDNSYLVLHDFWNPEFKVASRISAWTGSFDLDSMIGRHLNPGHVIEAMWFIMNAAQRMGDGQVIQKAADIVLAELDFAGTKNTAAFTTLWMFWTSRTLNFSGI